MLPYFIASASEKSTRAQAIGEVLSESDYDVIFFQEAFHSKPRKIIFDNLSRSFPYLAGPANRSKFSLKTNSGLWVFSKYPIISHRSIIYQTRHGIDAFSRKGALLVELNIHGQLVQVAGTHLQNCGPAWLKKMQCVEFYERLLKPAQREGVPQIICGDFNIDRRKESESYEAMLKLLDATDTNHDLASFSYDRVDNQLKNEKSADRDLIDYILVRDNGAVLTYTTSIRRLTRKWKQTYFDLSDHYSLHSEMTISPQHHSFASRENIQDQPENQKP
jgi:endonuclease/exonuclease/phosphatase family metal-dependent hydrolase